MDVWAPDELARDTSEGLRQVGIQNPGVLSCMPKEFVVGGNTVDDARPEDDLTLVPSVFQQVEQVAVVMER